jgi:hypothetical protein
MPNGDALPNQYGPAMTRLFATLQALWSDAGEPRYNYLARKAALGRNLPSRFLNGKAFPRREQFQALVAALGADPAEHLIVWLAAAAERPARGVRP